MKSKRRTIVVFTVLIILVGVLFWIDFNSGYTPLSLRDIGDLISGDAKKALRLSIIEFRLPRIITAFLIGIALSVSGCALQGVTRNDLADPGVLGINAGAGLMVALYISVFSKTLGQTSFMIPLLAFVGAFLAIFVVYMLTNRKLSGPNPARLILTGVAVSGALTSATLLILLRMKQEEYGFISGWLAGNIWGASWDNIKIMIPCIAVFLFIIWYKASTLNVMALGSQAATGLGVSLQKENRVILVAAVGLASCCVAVGGSISFVGLVCPHIVRRLIGSKHQLVIPGSILAGIIIMMLADIIGRSLIDGREIPVGAVATMIGTPYFLYLLVRKRKR